MFTELSELESDKCIIAPSREGEIQIVGLRIPSGVWIPIRADLKTFTDRACLAEVIRLWIAEKNWKVHIEPIGTKEHCIAIVTTATRVFTKISDDYLDCFFAVYMMALAATNESKELRIEE